MMSQAKYLKKMFRWLTNESKEELVGKEDAGQGRGMRGREGQGQDCLDQDLFSNWLLQAQHRPQHSHRSSLKLKTPKPSEEIPMAK